MGTTRQPAWADNNIIKFATDNRKKFDNKMTTMIIDFFLPVMSKIIDSKRSGP